MYVCKCIPTLMCMFAILNLYYRYEIPRPPVCVCDNMCTTDINNRGRPCVYVTICVFTTLVCVYTCKCIYTSICIFASVHTHGRWRTISVHTHGRTDSSIRGRPSTEYIYIHIYINIYIYIHILIVASVDAER